ncbi:MAG: hypothetical protein A2921_01735 [Candidatus Magasanikbacteria bacterium RIFCSPLOWO2_01_FULL_43_20b]|uniref:Uncharacterized protein n=1 Tax=Candidatus Magasanikbacteria bacterium RIFCSPLOWO2_12_FULL_43_12 TaxID=1798692 RepID=A0A1F6MW42_9BACT|nr:MAG: hypothetical protein A3I93_01195 [Candidatus Magasanikbacteria bacterium RIFCSPLOWO2_02_FULL_43_22]OGH72138.1 MAG: hypothetical protein A3C74_04200 [Candidatus Magasanikbacteria bacterium RIFCSPHIGHO2_02_FULL_44_13]OGH73236.1 MAG: hypothetical protein A2921_01735 [Candidatus Magasanikbacteria bacterium RIFCSPLOWO2_01_FULL_43_20b]OGH75643.1 MAG: hypothetical protein A3G00_04070 [Candidatus Magasanikbacteria bacterium RIFCSPLOWO2_12_FULL_43_12]
MSSGDNRRRVYGYTTKNHHSVIRKAGGRFWRKLGWLALVGLVFVFLIGTIMVAWASRDLPDPDKLTDRKVAQSTKILDRTGEHLLYEVYAQEKRTLVELDQVPQFLINGVIATEDTEFFQHKGIRPLSILRAVVYGVFTNKRIGGTSTLTQQLVKNAVLTNERKITRKIKEIILSIRLEQKYTKEQILKIYFNEIPYGSTNYGVESAAQSYFGKHVSDVTLAEAATLAGLPKAPSLYLNDPDKLKNRRDFVLERMVAEDYISREEADAAQAEPLKIKQKIENIQAPHFTLYVKGQLVDMFGEQLVDTGGLKVITSLDWEKQQAAELAIKENEKSLLEAGANNAALMAMDPKNGQILSMIGSRDFFDETIDGQFNVATLGKRQPGSSFKPIIYAAAFEKGYTPDTVLFDVLTNFAVSGKPYQPVDYDSKERGPVSMRQALQGSLNIPAVQTMYLVGQDKSVEFAKKMGYTTLSDGEFGLTLVLGGGEIKLLDHVRAYSVFAANGNKFEPVSILRVEDSVGGTLFEWKKTKGEKVLDEKITATISNVLSDDASRAYMFGAGGTLTLPNRSVAAKTGTTNNYVDAWTIGYTPSFVAGVWAGNTDNTQMKQGYGGSKVAGVIWNKFMREALKNAPVEAFPEAPPNDAEKPILRGSTGGAITLSIDKLTGKLASSSTPEKYIIQRSYLPAHSILHYVNKDDPRGPALENPADDPQYQIWENAIQDWIKRTKEKNPDWQISFEDPPTEYDDTHSSELAPTIEIIYPTDGAVLYSRQIDTNFRFGAPRGVTRVSYKIDARYVGVIKAPPFNLNYYAKWLESGAHTLIILAEDDIGNKTEQTINFTLQAGEEPPSVSWVEKNKTVSQNNFPIRLALEPFKLEQIKEILIYQQKSGEEKTILTTITDFSNLFNNQILFTWSSAPETGVWTLIAEVKPKNGGQTKSEVVEILVK